ncbi:MAG: Asp-tRNA(Asn)/Glu-tRNA(Gln) amidotransferase subunit GatB [Anaerolineales bacterium]
MEYEAIIGMEVHAQLLTRSKMFCACAADYAAAPPNTRVCPVCLGMPGTLPVINRRAVEFVVMTGLALHCRIADHSRFARKNYHYPDLPKGYQISQYELPLCSDGYLEIEVDGQVKRIGIERVHLEEDTAKLIHTGDYSLIDANRAGVPLMEIVSAPDLRTGEEARQYLTRLRTILRYLGVSSGNMEEGSMRCEVNISLRPAGTNVRGTKVEVKNLNSFRSVKQAIEYETERQRRLLESGERVVQVTMGWDEAHGRTVLQRVKESADDYRYFPEPDLPPLELSRQWVEEIRARLPELPEARRERFVRDYGLSAYDAGVLTADRDVADFFEAVVGLGGDAKGAANWITGEIFRLMNARGLEMSQMPIRPAQLCELMGLIQEGVITTTIAKDVLGHMVDTGESPGDIVRQRGLAQVRDTAALEGVARQVIADNPDAVAQYLAGKEQVLRFLVGQMMKATRGQANPTLAAEILKALLAAPHS